MVGGLLVHFRSRTDSPISVKAISYKDIVQFKLVNSNLGKGISRIFSLGKGQSHTNIFLIAEGLVLPMGLSVLQRKGHKRLYRWPRHCWTQKNSLFEQCTYTQVQKERENKCLPMLALPVVVYVLIQGTRCASNNVAGILLFHYAIWYVALW